jgi:hypothetical protein
MSKLREAARAAAKEQQATRQEEKRKQREEALDKVMERFYDDYRGFGRLGKTGYDVRQPEREAFEYVSGVAKDGGHQSSVSGFRVEIEGVPFLFCTDYNDHALYVLLTCPDCGALRADTFHGLDDLGRKLEKGRTTLHHCREVESRRLAYAIGSAARDLQISPAEVVEEALDRHWELIVRLLR